MGLPTEQGGLIRADNMIRNASVKNPVVARSTHRDREVRDVFFERR